MEREIARLEEAGTAVVSLEPGPESRRVMGLRAMAEDRSPRVIEAAYEETRRRILASPFLASLGEPRHRRERRLTPREDGTPGSSVRSGNVPEGRVR